MLRFDRCGREIYNCKFSEQPPIGTWEHVISMVDGESVSGNDCEATFVSGRTSRGLHR